VLPSEWLRDVNAHYLYREDRLKRLAVCDIGYEGGILTSHIWSGTYPTYGRLASVNLITPRQAVSMYKARLKADEEGMLVLGCDIAAALWDLLHPITMSGPPSRWEKRDLIEKMRLDVDAIRRFGY
jgi:hypothetical protein